MICIDIDNYVNVLSTIKKEKKENPEISHYRHYAALRIFSEEFPSDI